MRKGNFGARRTLFLASGRKPLDRATTSVQQDQCVSVEASVCAYLVARLPEPPDTAPWVFKHLVVRGLDEQFMAEQAFERA